MGISALALLLAGFALAHAAWSVSDLPAGDLLTPLAMTTPGEQTPPTLIRYVGATQDEAIAKGRAEMDSLRAKGQPWAFVREGLLPEGGTKQDVLLVELWGPGMDAPLSLVQRFRPAAARGGFQLLGAPLVAVGGVVQPDSAVATVLEAVMEGVRRHKQAAAQWEAWHGRP